jgi:hypothetical protein
MQIKVVEKRSRLFGLLESHYSALKPVDIYSDCTLRIYYAGQHRNPLFRKNIRGIPPAATITL